MLIRCPECDKEISSEASSCPYCGYPIKKLTTDPSSPIYVEKYTEAEIRTLIKEAKEYESSYMAFVVFGIILIIISIIVFVVCMVAQIDYETGTILGVLSGVGFFFGIIVLAIGGSVNSTKYNNRSKIVNDYKKRHPDFKE